MGIYTVRSSYEPRSLEFVFFIQENGGIKRSSLVFCIRWTLQTRTPTLFDLHCASGRWLPIDTMQHRCFTFHLFLAWKCRYRCHGLKSDSKRIHGTGTSPRLTWVSEVHLYSLLWVRGTELYHNQLSHQCLSLSLPHSTAKPILPIQTLRHLSVRLWRSIPLTVDYVW